MSIMSEALIDSRAHQYNKLLEKAVGGDIQEVECIRLQQIIESEMVGTPQLYLTMTSKDETYIDTEELVRVLSNMCIVLARKGDTHIWLFVGVEHKYGYPHIHAIVCSEKSFEKLDLKGGVSRWVKGFGGSCGFVTPTKYRGCNLSGLPRDVVAYTYRKHIGSPFSVFCPQKRRCCRGKKGCLYNRHPEKCLRSEGRRENLL